MIKFKQYTEYKGIQDIHDNLQRISWIINNKMPYPGDDKLDENGKLLSDKKSTSSPFEDFFGVKI